MLLRYAFNVPSWMEGLLKRAHGIEISLISGGLPNERCLRVFWDTCQQNLLLLFDDFSVCRRNEGKQRFIYFTIAVMIGIYLYVAKKQIGYRIKVIDYL